MDQICEEDNGTPNKLQDSMTVSPLLVVRSSHTISTTAKQIAENIYRSNSSTETVKYKLTITSERLAQLKKIVEDAVKEHKIFTVKGGWQILKSTFLSRNWVEKIESLNNKQKPHSAPTANIDDLCCNLPSKQTWETPAAHKEKCEKTIMSRLLHLHDCDFYWNMRKDQSDWHHRVNNNKIMNRFSRSLFTSKEGLCLLLQQMYWHNEVGVAHVNFPRCYVLGFPDHFNNFVDDFRLTACAGMLKWYVNRVESTDEYEIKSPEGKVPFSAIQFAMNRLDEFIATKKHMDIDKDFPKTWDHEWDQFLTHFFRAVHQNAAFIEAKEWSLNLLHAGAKVTLQEVSKYCPQFHLDGMKNIWILKPGNKCRGRGIQLVKKVEDVTKIMNMKLKYVVQKYIERPLIIYQTKFDIRQWFMVTSVQPLTIWMYRESYLRFSSQIFSLDNFHESLHLTNYAVQCKYTNVVQRDKALPDENMWDCHTFKAYLKQIGHGNKWDEVIFPGMRECLIASMLACQETMDRRPNTFELYGADFILAEDFTPWLLEINSSPDLSSSTSVTARMCPQCLEDVVKVMVDRRKDPKADTGLFDLIYKQNFPRPPAYLGMSLSVRGRRVFKNRVKRAKPTGKENEISKKDAPHLKPPALALVQPCYTPKPISGDMYDGPIIGDLMEELQTSYLNSCENGVDFVPSATQSPPKMKKKNMGNKHERVAKSEYGPSKNQTNHKRSCLCRKSSGSENARRKGAPQTTSKIKVKDDACFGLFGEWSVRNKFGHVSRKDHVWERETASILKGKNILSKFDVHNKGELHNGRCLDAVGVGAILPQLNVPRNGSTTCKNFLTVGVNFRNCQSALSK